MIKKTGATLIHSFENEDVIAGQGTAAVELLEDVPDLDVVMCPVGGGGLLSGTAVAAKSMRPKIKVIAVEPANADDAAQSFRAGRRIVTEKKFTIADGLRTNVGEPNFAIIQRYVDDIVTVSEEAIVSAMRTIWETMKIVIEPSAAVPYAAIQGNRRSTSRGNALGLFSPAAMSIWTRCRGICSRLVASLGFRQYGDPRCRSTVIACRLRTSSFAGRLRRTGGHYSAGENFSNLCRSPEFAESAWPAPVDDAVSSGFAHALSQRGIRHQRSNRAREVFDVV